MRTRGLIPVLAALSALCAAFSVVAGTLPTAQQKKARTVTLTIPAWETAPYWADVDYRLLVDFGNLAMYHAADLQLGAPAAGIDRVVFVGDSITEGWDLAKSFPGKPYINRGISGQTTSQILLRFRQDVLNLHPKVTVILAGTNDLAGNTGPATVPQIESNLESMAQLARANGIHVVLCSLLPTVRYPWHPEALKPAPRIAALNRWMKAYAAREREVYVNYYAALKDPSGAFRHDLSPDGVHPSPAGFAIMAPLAQAGINEALTGGGR